MKPLRTSSLSVATGLALLVSAWSAPGIAAESLDTCTGYIDSLPAVISSQGTWCMRADLSTVIDSGSAISVQVNNVTIDCNDFKLGGLGAGPSSSALGISTPSSRSNVTVRRCNIRGFFNGISFGSVGNAGLIVEDNRFDGNLVRAIFANGDGHVVRRNRITDTGGTASGFQTYAIQMAADASVVEDNAIFGVFTDTADTHVYGIFINGQGNIVRGNRIGNLVANGSGGVRGVALDSDGKNLVEGNVMINSPAMPGFGVRGAQPGHYCVGNRVIGFSSGLLSNCTDGGDNLGE